ncbi:MAG TPA: OsmC family protein [Candidatus Acidoferrales bacterium]|nr:OsmC family protein [Candidatus Acidoferrales bacterium]
MADQAHEFETTVEWTSDRVGTLSTVGRPAIPMGAPPEFGGADNVWSPEHLCVAAVNSCVMLTFIAIAANSKVAFRTYTSSAAGTLERVEGRGPVITRIVVKPRITIAPDVDRAKVERIVKMAEKNCYISNSLQSAVTLEPEIVVE